MSAQTCTLCPLYLTAQRGVPGEGPVPAEWMLVGEAPGAEEDRLGRPFVGRAGKVLDWLLEGAQVSRQDVYVTNLVKHRPPENRKPLAAEIKVCAGWLEQELLLVLPRVVVAMGEFAVKWMLGKKRAVMQQEHGRVQWATHQQWTGLVLPTYHPAAALYDPGLLPLLAQTFAGLREVAVRQEQVDYRLVEYALVGEGGKDGVEKG